MVSFQGNIGRGGGGGLDKKEKNRYLIFQDPNDAYEGPDSTVLRDLIC